MESAETSFLSSRMNARRGFEGRLRVDIESRDDNAKHGSVDGCFFLLILTRYTHSICTVNKTVMMHARRKRKMAIDQMPPRDAWIGEKMTRSSMHDTTI